MAVQEMGILLQLPVVLLHWGLYKVGEILKIFKYGF